jgi:hypothetical protein
MVARGEAGTQVHQGEGGIVLSQLYEVHGHEQIQSVGATPSVVVTDKNSGDWIWEPGQGKGPSWANKAFPFHLPWTWPLDCL